MQLQNILMSISFVHSAHAMAIWRRQDLFNDTTTPNIDPSTDPSTSPSGFDFGKCFVNTDATSPCKVVWAWTQSGQCILDPANGGYDSGLSAYNSCQYQSECRDDPGFLEALDGFVKPFIQKCGEDGVCLNVNYDELPQTCRDKYPLVTAQNPYGWDNQYGCERSPPNFGSDYGLPGSTVPRPYVCLGIGGAPLSRDCVLQFCNPLLTLSKPQMDPCYPDTPTLIAGCKSCDTGAAFINQFGAQLTMDGYGAQLSAYCKQAPYCYADLFRNIKDTSGSCASKLPADPSSGDPPASGDPISPPSVSEPGSSSSPPDWNASDQGETDRGGSASQPNEPVGDRPGTSSGGTNAGDPVPAAPSGATDATSNTSSPADAAESGTGQSANGGGSTGATVGRPTLSRAVADAATSGTRSANTAFAAGTAAAAANSSGVELRAHGIALLLGSAIMFFYL